MSAWAERRCIHSEDDKLRKFGYTIASRPKSGPVLWWPPWTLDEDGCPLRREPLTQAQALVEIDQIIASVKTDR